MPNCSNCGKYIKPTEVFRREIYVGNTKRTYYGKRISFNNSNYYRMQNVCYDCAKLIDEANKKKKNQIKILLLILIIIILFYVILKK